MTSVCRNPALALLAAVCLLSACHLLRPAHQAAQTQHADELDPATLHIQQAGYGSDAHFAHCAAPLCLRTTPKTLARADAPIQRVAPDATPVLNTSTIAPSASEQLPQSAVVLHNAEPRRVVLRFETNSAHLTSAHKASLSEALQSLKRTDHIVIVGRTDSLGSEPANQTLALARGLAVRDHLLDLAPDLPARIAIDAKGRCCYVASNGSGPGRALNRRVELIYAPRNEVAL